MRGILDLDTLRLIVDEKNSKTELMHRSSIVDDVNDYYFSKPTRKILEISKQISHFSYVLQRCCQSAVAASSATFSSGARIFLQIKAPQRRLKTYALISSPLAVRRPNFALSPRIIVLHDHYYASAFTRPHAHARRDAQNSLCRRPMQITIIASRSDILEGGAEAPFGAACFRTNGFRSAVN